MTRPALWLCVLALACEPEPAPVDATVEAAVDACEGCPATPDVPVCNPPQKCKGGLEPLDADDDGCADDCPTPRSGDCKKACDCYALGLEFPDPCTRECATCGSYWQCEKKQCVPTCGALPAEIQTCSQR